ncbi:MAG: 50S ribosomal protein L28 [Deltaproteobacteria bacterium]|nr:50S ribosomal protein L28 [Deltaproteobacteria bacterium]
MSRRCSVCEKTPQGGNKVSHANNKTHTRNFPNIQRVKAFVAGKIKHILACTRCIRSGFVTKA